MVIDLHDGDFSPIVDEVEMLRCRVICLCDPKSLSSLLKEKVEVMDVAEVLSMRNAGLYPSFVGVSARAIRV